MRPAPRYPGLTILALLLLVAGPLGAATHGAPPSPPPSPPGPAAAVSPPPPASPPDVDSDAGDIDLHAGDLDVEVREHGPAFVTVVHAARSFIGVRLLDLTPELRELYTGSKDSGVLVSFVEADSPAAKAGIRVGDVIVKVGGESVSRSPEISRAVRNKEPGQKVTLEVRRDKTARTIEVAVAERKGSRHEFRMPDIGGHGFSFHTDDWDERISEQVERAIERTQEKLQQIEKRLQELERRWQTK